MSSKNPESSSGSASPDLISVIAGFVEQARTEGAMAPIGLSDMENPGIKPPAVRELCREIRKAGFRGNILAFFRSNFRAGQVPIGVPLRPIEPIENEIPKAGVYFGLYLPPKNTPIPRPELQRKLDGVVNSAIGPNEKELPFGGGILVTDSEAVEQWNLGGMWPVDPAVLDPENAGFSLKRDLLAREADRNGRKFMEKEYLPAFLKAVGMLREHGMVPAQLSAEKNPANVFVRLNEIFLSVNFPELINTNHSSRQRRFILERDTVCHYPRTNLFPAGERFSVEDLIEMDRLSAIRDLDDPKRDLMGLDDTGFYLEDENGSPRPVCGLYIPGRYMRIAPNIKFLKAEEGDWQLHHIIARGAAFMALLTGILKNDIDGRETPEEMMLYLRAARVRDLVSGKAWPHYANRQEVLRTLADHVLAIDQAVNSPFNMVALCSNCHQTLAHPDMPFAASIADFIEDLNRGVELDLLNHDFFASRGRGKLSPRQIIHDLHQARQLVLSVGGLYYPNNLMSDGGDTSDILLDYARKATRAHIEQQKDEKRGEILESSHGTTDPSRLHASWLAIQSLQDEPPAESLKDFYIRRDPSKLERFQEWLK